MFISKSVGWEITHFIFCAGIWIWLEFISIRSFTKIYIPDSVNDKSFEENFIVKVLELEKDKLDLLSPRLKSEVVDIVKTLVTEKDLNQDDIIDNEEEVW